MRLTRTGEVLPDWLPAGAQAKLELLRQGAREANALLRLAADELDVARRAQQHARDDIARLKNPAGMLRADAATLATAHRRLEVETENLIATTGEFERKQLQAQPRGELVSNIHSWITRQDVAVAASPARTAATAIRRGEAPADGVRRIRVEIAETKAARSALEIAPVPAGEARARARALVANLAEANGLQIEPLFQPVGPPLADEVLPHALVTVLVSSSPTTGIPALASGGVVRVVDAAALVAFAVGPMLAKALEAAIDAIADDALAVPTAERAGRESKLHTALLALERQEEALVEAAQQGGIAIERRADANPIAILGIEIHQEKELAA